jgi:hypothetical protein
MALIIEEGSGGLTTYAQMQIYIPEYMSPDNISDMLRLQPTDKKVKGDIVCRPSGRKVITVPISYWLLSTRHLLKHANMETHLEWLLNCLMPARDQILALQKVPGIFMQVRCILNSEERNTNFTAEQVKKLAELNTECFFVLYFDTAPYE